jgi:N-acetylglucosaminyldiphosphoundecaprenol N-acetyl-beta-D-mannosaminyltransferase
VERVDVLGVPVDPVTVDELHQRIRTFVQTGARATVLHANVHAVNLACRHAWLARIFREADLVFCDGAGVQFGARLLGRRLPARITYADWMWQLAAWCEAQDLSLFLLGARPGVADQAAARLRARHPRLRIVGTHHGFFDKSPGSAETLDVIARLNAARPDLVIVGFGMPLQEQWTHAHRARIDAPVVLTGGAAFDYVSGRLRRAPTWMTNHGLEWLGRLAIEPHRLMGRYVAGNPLFLARVLRERLRHWPRRAPR